MSALRVYCDGLCPLCTKEINHIKRLDTWGLLDMQDINADGFEQRFPHIDRVQADRILHGELADGRIILGQCAGLAIYADVSAASRFKKVSLVSARRARAENSVIVMGGGSQSS